MVLFPKIHDKSLSTLKVQPRPLKTLGPVFHAGVKLLFPTDFLINYTHLHSNQDQLGFRQNRAKQPNTFQSGADRFYTTRDDVLFFFFFSFQWCSLDARLYTDAVYLQLLKKYLSGITSQRAVEGSNVNDTYMSALHL